MVHNRMRVKRTRRVEAITAVNDGPDPAAFAAEFDPVTAHQTHAKDFALEFGQQRNAQVVGSWCPTFWQG